MRIGRGVLAVVLSSMAGSAIADDGIYIEFLWSRPAPDSIARQQTRQFVTESGHDHQVCVAANAADADVGGLWIELADARGEMVSRQSHPDYRGTKRCYRADFGQGGTAGEWTARVRLGDGRAQEAGIRVDPRIEDSPHYLERDVPYVAGRPNYDASIPAAEWSGRLVWAMDVDPQGRVTHVEVEVAEGVGERIRDRAIAAGYMSLFPPDPARATTPLRWRRTLSFAPE